MTGQRASRLKWNGNFVFGSSVLTNMPAYGSLVAEVIGGWSAVEATLGRTFAMLIGSKQPVTMSMYGAVRSFEVQRDLLKAAADEVLPKTHAALFTATLLVIGRAAKHRHRFAHWVWGASADPNLEALLLVEPREFWNVTAKQVRFWNRQGRRRLETGDAYSLDPMMPQLSHDHIYVYRLKELEQARDEVEHAFSLTDAWRELLAANGARRRRTMRWLSSQADIQSALAKAKSDPRTKRRPQPSIPSAAKGLRRLG